MTASPLPRAAQAGVTRIPFESLGHADHGWLDARHHFSFADYYDPARTGHGPLLVWNDDTIAPGTGFPKHPHRDMEIITYVRSGAITHEDHLGNRGRTEAGDVQVMSAGKGILHAEFNMDAEPTTLFQIWIQPHTARVEPRWEQRRFPKADRAGALVPLASGRDADIARGALRIHQDAALLGATLDAGQSVTHALGADRLGYLVVARGRASVNGVALGPRDGAALTGLDSVTIDADEETELLLADLPGEA
ncbi:MAG: pirin family protein [Inquilinaceae bacterium]